MTDFAQVVARLSAEGSPLGATSVIRGNELHGRLAPGGARQLAEHLHSETGAELALMVAEDRRAIDGGFAVHYLFAQRAANWFVHATQPVDPHHPVIDSLAVFHYPASRFEREIRDLFGIVPEGHPDPRPLVRHGFWPDDYHPLRKDEAPRAFEDDGRTFPFGEVRGEGVYEIPVGPVHAGVIEPGHFRFSVVGETIIDMKSRLYFTHKGTEKLFEGRDPADGVALAERISGDTSVGHAVAYCQAVEAATGLEAPERAQYVRVVLLELERLYNHVGDVGAIANDTGFAVAQSHCLRIRERLMRLNKRVAGHRLLRGVVAPGGVHRDVPADLDLPGEIDRLVADFAEVADIVRANTLVMDRLEGTGRLTTATARDHGVLGVVARASGLDIDARRDHPYAAYARLRFDVPVFTTGDVLARTLVRVEEIHQSAGLIRQAVEAMPHGPLAPARDTLDAALRSASGAPPAFGVVEGWRGLIVHWVRVDRNGRLERVKAFDPSFLNWRPLSYAVLNNIVPDFPLCNKSFNQSYSGNDL